MIEFSVLGNLTFQRDHERQAVPTVMLRRGLAVLLARAGTEVSADTMIDSLWDGAPPPSARRTLSVYMSRLRALLSADDRLEAFPGSYAIHPGAAELDSTRFRHLTGESAAAAARGDMGRARGALQTALALWRGPAFDGFRDMRPVAAEADVLDQLRLAAFEDWIDLELTAGRHRAVMAHLDELTAAQPYRERLRGQRMIALYRDGRRADALGEYRRTYRLLTEDLGVGPSAVLTAIHQRILTDDPELISGPAPIAFVASGPALTVVPDPPRRPGFPAAPRDGYGVRRNAGRFPARLMLGSPAA